MFFDPLYIVMILPAILLAMWAQFKVKSAYAKYSRLGTRQGFSGAEAATEILRAAGLENVPIEPVGGELTDHYDPKTKTLHLSTGVYGGRSIAAVGIAAHEVGHAVQHARHYVPLRFRNAFFPAASFGSKAAFPLILIGFLLSLPSLVKVAIVLFSFAVVFQLVTLPVEFNATRRAKAALTRTGILTTDEEKKGVNQVLGAAALTYVAATVTALAQLMYFILRSRR